MWLRWSSYNVSDPYLVLYEMILIGRADFLLRCPALHAQIRNWGLGWAAQELAVMLGLYSTTWPARHLPGARPAPMAYPSHQDLFGTKAVKSFANKGFSEKLVCFLCCLFQG